MPKLLNLLLPCLLILIAGNGYSQQTMKADTTNTIKTARDSVQANSSVLDVPGRYQNCNPRSPILAGVLAVLLPTGGQIYNKQYLKAGVIWVVAGVITIGIVTTLLNYRFHSNGSTDLYLDLLAADAFYAIIDAPLSAIYLNNKYHLHKKKHDFSSLRLEPNVTNTNAGSGNSMAYGFTLVLR